MVNTKQLERILAMTKGFGEGINQTAIPFLSVVRRSQPTPFTPAVLTPSFCVILQGKKKVHVGKNVIEFGPGDFAASVVTMPTAGHVAEATKANPYVGLRIDFTTQEIASVITEAGIKIEPKDQKPQAGAFVGKTDSAILELFIKLLQVLDKLNEVTFISALIKREMIFRFLTGPYGHLFFQRVLFDQTVNGVGNAIEWIRQNFATPFTVEQLAKSHGLSVSSLHHKFKAITTMGPLQYQKQLRLLEARRIMLGGLIDATTAALEVGYESPSQFNREYRRLFGLPPLKDIKAFRKNSGGSAFSGS